MEVARQNFAYPEEIISYPETKQEKEDPAKTKATPKPSRNTYQKAYRREKIFVGGIFMLLICACTALLLSYEANTEVRHEIHQLTASIRNLENDERALRVQTESIARSNRIEALATEEIGMIYPTTHEVNYRSLDSSRVTEVRSHLVKFRHEEVFELTRYEVIRNHIYDFLDRWMIFF